MRNIKLVLEYDGTKFYGFQKQPKRPTIQSALENALGKLLNRPMKIKSASGRTDSGVHAEGQVVNFETEADLKLHQIQQGLNRYLPREIAVVQVEEAPKKFHARFSARSKTYEYRVWNGSARSPLRAPYTHHVRARLDVKKMRAAAKFLTGRHDFRSFCSSGGAGDDGKTAGKSRKNTVRTLHRFEIKREGNLIRFRVEADGFLYHMVRNLVGTLLETGRGQLTLPDLEKVLKARDRREAGMKVPASGLTLLSVTY